MASSQYHFIDISQIRIGLYIHLDLGWMDHPFTFSNFKIKDADQLTKIRETGLKKLRYDPKRSDCEPLPLGSLPEHVVIPVTEDIERMKQRRLRELHLAIDESEKKFLQTTQTVRQALRNFEEKPEISIQQTKQLVNELAHTVITEPDIAVHAVNGNRSADENYLHPVNVTMLSIMLCKSLSMIEADAKAIGLAAIFHDIGKAKIADAILLKETPLNEEELAEMRKHCEYGAQMAKESGLSERISKVILQHHEYADGSGYPQQLKGSDIDPLARLIAIVSAYDNLCNPQHGGHALTPYEALSHMFSHQRSKFDEWILKQFIKSLGVYPPGSVVQLSNGAHAIVISVNPNKPLKPFVLVHDPDKVREAPLVIDLREEPSLAINLCLRPHQLPPESLIYLNPRQRVSYFVDKDLAAGRSK